MADEEPVVLDLTRGTRKTVLRPMVAGTGSPGEAGPTGPAGLAVVVYSGSLSTARPDVPLVYWVNFPSEPTHALDYDFWLEPA